MDGNRTLNKQTRINMCTIIHRCLNDGMAALALKPIALIGSPKYRILSGGVLLSEVNLLAISVEIFLPISAPIPLKSPPSAKQIAESADAPMASPPATPAPTIPSLIIVLPSLPKLLPILPLTTGAPKGQIELSHMGYYLICYIAFVKKEQQLHRGCAQQLYQFHGVSITTSFCFI